MNNKDRESAGINMQELARNEYPGRGLVLGLSDQKEDVVVYWLMGRSVNSRNRKLIVDEDEGTIRTEPCDPSKFEDTSGLLLYTAVSEIQFNGRRCQVVSNGDHTDTIIRAMHGGGLITDFNRALRERSYEQDPPIYTPRIAGLLIPHIALGDSHLRFGIISRLGEDDDIQAWEKVGDPVYSFNDFYEEAGLGRMLHTYEDGDPPPPFIGRPRLVLLTGNAEEIGKTYWNLLNEQNRVSLAVKTIARKNGRVSWVVFSQYQNVNTGYMCLGESFSVDEITSGFPSP